MTFKQFITESKAVTLPKELLAVADKMLNNIKSLCVQKNWDKGMVYINDENSNDHGHEWNEKVMNSLGFVKQSDVFYSYDIETNLSVNNRPVIIKHLVSNPNADRLGRGAFFGSKTDVMHSTNPIVFEVWIGLQREPWLAGCGIYEYDNEVEKQKQGVHTVKNVIIHELLHVHEALQHFNALKRYYISSKPLRKKMADSSKFDFKSDVNQYYTHKKHITGRISAEFYTFLEFFLRETPIDKLKAFAKNGDTEIFNGIYKHERWNNHIKQWLKSLFTVPYLKRKLFEKIYNHISNNNTV